jgi:ketosteroid isomerase-like protein
LGLPRVDDRFWPLIRISKDKPMTSNSPSATEIADLVARAAEMNDAFMNGRMDAWLALANPADDFSIMTPFGGWTTGGFDAAPEKLAGMARRFPSGTTSLEVVATYASGDMVVLAAIERQHAVVGDLPPQDWSLRVTLVFRRSGTDWEMVHRHADPLVQGISLGQSATIARGELGSSGAPG